MPKDHLTKTVKGTNTIAIRKNLNPNSVNLAFVSGPSIFDNGKIVVNDNTPNININPTEDIYEENIYIINSENYVSTNNSLVYIDNTDILITDVFYIDNNKKKYPLYYVCNLNTEIDINIKNEQKSLIPYRNDNYYYLTYQDLDINNETLYEYIGKKIQIEDNDCKYRIVISKKSLNENILKANIFIYTDKNITGKKVIIYNNDTIYTEVALSELVYIRDDKFVDDMLSTNYEEYISINKKYKIEDINGKYVIKIPSKSYIIEDKLRNKINIRYKLYCNIREKYDHLKRGKINIGVYSIGKINNMFYSAALSELNKNMPYYIELNNPYPHEYYTSVIDKNNPNYWNMSLDISISQLLEYDVIIIAGAGYRDLSVYNEKLKIFLSNGGSLLIDNNGTNGAELNINGFEKNFFVDVEFNGNYNINQIMSLKNENDEFNILNRLYDFTKDKYVLIGANISPLMGFKTTTTEQMFKPIVYQSANNSIYNNIVIARYFNRGIVAISNCGILSGIILNKNFSNNVQFLKNLITVFGEDKWITTPWMYDYLYHKEQLFSCEYFENNGPYIVGLCEYTLQEVAKKIVIHDIYDILYCYNPGIYNINKDDIKIDIEEYKYNNDKGKFEYVSSNDIYYSYFGKNLTIYTTRYKDDKINIEQYGYDKTNSLLKSKSINVVFETTIYKYVYNEETKKVEKMPIQNPKIYPENGFITINSSNVSTKIEKLVSMIPNVPSTIDYNDKYNIYFEVKCYEVDKNMKYKNNIDVYIYDVNNNRYYFDIDGNASINYIKVADEKLGTNVYVFVENKAKDVLITNSKISILQYKSKRINIDIEKTFDERGKKRIKIRRFYITKDLKNGESIIYKINNYDMQFLTKNGYKKYKGKVKILNTNKIDLQKTNINYINRYIEKHKLSKISQNTYKSFIYDELEQGCNISVYVKENNNYTKIDESNYTIDYRNFIINFDFDIDENQEVYVDFSYNNLRIYKRTPDIIKHNKKVLKRIDEKRFIIDDETYDKLEILNVKLYYTVDFENYIPLQYDQFYYDDEACVIEFNTEINGNIVSDSVLYGFNRIEISNIDVSSGIVYVNEELSILDYIVAEFEYYDDYYDYSGYFNNGVFEDINLNIYMDYINKINMLDNTIKLKNVISNTAYIYCLPAIIKKKYIAVVNKNIIKKVDNKFVVDDQYIQEKENIDNAIKIGSANNSLLSINNVNKIIYYGNSISDNASKIIMDCKYGTDIINTLDKNTYIIPVNKIASDVNFDYYECNLYIHNNIRHTIDKNELDEILKDENVLYLGNVSYDFNFDKNDVTLIDARSRGGGIKENVDIDFIAKNYEQNIYSFWDIGDYDNICYYENGVIIIRIPKNIKSYDNKNITHEYIDNVIRNSIPAGVKYIIEYV